MILPVAEEGIAVQHLDNSVLFYPVPSTLPPTPSYQPEWFGTAPYLATPGDGNQGRLFGQPYGFTGQVAYTAVRFAATTTHAPDVITVNTKFAQFGSSPRLRLQLRTTTNAFVYERGIDNPDTSGVARTTDAFSDLTSGQKAAVVGALSAGTLLLMMVLEKPESDGTSPVGIYPSTWFYDWLELVFTDTDDQQIPLRQRQRDDGLGLSSGRAINVTSRQRSLRQRGYL